MGRSGGKSLLKFQCPGRRAERVIKAPSQWNGLSGKAPDDELGRDKIRGMLEGPMMSVWRGNRATANHAMLS